MNAKITLRGVSEKVDLILNRLDTVFDKLAVQANLIQWLSLQIKDVADSVDMLAISTSKGFEEVHADISILRESRKVETA